MKSNTSKNFDEIFETDTRRLHVPLHQITGEILRKYTDIRGSCAYLVQNQMENEAPLVSVECMLHQNGVYQHYFVTHTTNDAPTHLPHYLTKTLSNA